MEREDQDQEDLSPNSKMLSEVDNEIPTPISATKKAFVQECEAYEALARCPPDETILSWWRRHASQLPILSSFARGIGHSGIIVQERADILKGWAYCHASAPAPAARSSGGSDSQPIKSFYVMTIVEKQIRLSN